jgi:hypothetical protein
MTTVQVERPEDIKLSDWFAELRLWFDNHDCSPARFVEAGRAMDRDRERFNLTFADEVHAQSFVSAFSKYGASIRRPISDAEPVAVTESLQLTEVPAEMIEAETVEQIP